MLAIERRIGAKKKKFREGQQKQILDILFFDYIELGEKLKPKIIIAENVPGILKGNAKSYVHRIYNHFEKIGYTMQHYTLDARFMNVPQRRERVFFIAVRNDLIEKLPKWGIFGLPFLNLGFKYKQIVFEEISDENDKECRMSKAMLYMHQNTVAGNSYEQTSIRLKGKSAWFSNYKLSYNEVPHTLVSTPVGGDAHPIYDRMLNKNEILKAATFPQDYNFMECEPKYICGMSVPPFMIYHISLAIYTQWNVLFNN